MGRPVKKEYFGNTSIQGQTIRGNAWVNGDTMARPAWISRQLGTNRYFWHSVDGTAPGNLGGPCELVDGAITGPGQANIKIYATGSETGSGATAIANLGVETAEVVVSGSGSITDDYLVGEKLLVSGGTYTGNQQGNVTVASTKIGAIQTNNKGHNYAQGDYFYMSGTGWVTNANVVVNTVNGTGAITSLNIVSAGVFTGTKPSEPFNAVTWHTASGAGANFDARFAVNALTVLNHGDYRAIPANPVTLTGSASGTGATANLTYYVNSVKLTNSGSGYAYAPMVSLDAGNANVRATVSGGSVDALYIDFSGHGYTAVPTITIADSMATSHVRVLRDLTVNNWQGQTYQWLTEGNTLPGPGWAHIETH
jgi:hypothetical protein